MTPPETMLLPCPFCGQDAAVYSDQFRHVRCNNCFARTQQGPEEVVSKDWNTRPAQSPALAEAIGALERIRGMCGIPDAVDACRLICNEAQALITSLRTMDVLGGGDEVSIHNAALEEAAVMATRRYKWWDTKQSIECLNNGVATCADIAHEIRALKKPSAKGEGGG